MSIFIEGLSLHFQCENGEICRLSVDRREIPHAKEHKIKNPIQIKHFDISCSPVADCEMRMRGNYAHGGDHCKQEPGEIGQCTQCCYHNNCFSSQGYVDKDGRLFNPSSWNIAWWQKNLRF